MNDSYVSGKNSQRKEGAETEWANLETNREKKEDASTVTLVSEESDLQKHKLIDDRQKTWVYYIIDDTCITNKIEGHHPQSIYNPENMHGRFNSGEFHLNHTTWTTSL